MISGKRQRALRKKLIASKKRQGKGTYRPRPERHLPSKQDIVLLDFCGLDALESRLLLSSTFMGLEDFPNGAYASNAFAVSRSATNALDAAVVGNGNNGSYEATIWKDGSNVAGYGTGSTNENRSRATDVLSNGTHVTGLFDINADDQAFVWTQVGGFVELGDIGNDGINSVALGITSDGNTIVGQGTLGNDPRAVVWKDIDEDGIWETNPTTPTPTDPDKFSIAELPGSLPNSFANDISADGMVAVGNYNGGNVAVLWAADTPGVFSSTPVELGEDASRAFGVSADGSVIVGDSGANGEAYLWEGGALTSLDTPQSDPGDLFNWSRAQSVSADGQFVVGWGGTNQGERAFIWDDEGRIRDLHDVLVTDYGLADELAGWTLLRAYDISDSGNVIVGYGIDELGQEEAWIAVLEPDVSLGTLSGRVFDDLDNDGVFEPGIGDAGIEGVTMLLRNGSGTIVDSVDTEADGSFVFENVADDDYSIEQAEQPEGYLDGRETAGSLGGTVDNTMDSNTIGDIHVSGAPTYATAVLDDAPILYWQLNESDKSAGQVAVNSASTGAAYNGTYGGIVDSVTDGPFAGSAGAQFDNNPSPSGSTGDFIRLDTSAGTNPYISDAVTYELWLRSDSSGQQHGLFSFANSTALQNASTLFLDRTNTVFYINNEGALVGVTQPEIFDGNWNHLVLTWESSTGELVTYFNGVVVSTQIHESGTLIDPTGTLIFGQEQDSLGGGFDINQNFEGDVAEIAVYDKVLSASQVQMHFSSAEELPPNGENYLFAEIRPSSIQGLVWEDFNDDAEVDFGEAAIEGVEIIVSGIDDRGNNVNLSMETDDQGIYEFVDLRPGTYLITEMQPATHQDGQDSLGEIITLPIEGCEAPLPTIPANDQFEVVFPCPDSHAVNFNFGERPLDSGDVESGQTATIGFWQNKNGQNLIKAVNGGDTSTQLGDWLAATFPNLYGSMSNLTNDAVADVYKQLFKRNNKTSPGGPPKLDAQVLAVAFATYVTNENLAGTTAANYGFTVSDSGVGTSTFDIGENGAAFGVADYSILSIMDILLATDDFSFNGLLYDDDEDGDLSAIEMMLRAMANEVYSAINEQGDI